MMRRIGFPTQSHTERHNIEGHHLCSSSAVKFISQRVVEGRGDDLLEGRGDASLEGRRDDRLDGREHDLLGRR